MKEVYIQGPEMLSSRRKFENILDEPYNNIQKFVNY